MKVKGNGHCLDFLILHKGQRRRDPVFDPFQTQMENPCLISLLGRKVSKGEGPHGKEVNRHIFAKGTVETRELRHVDDEEIEGFLHAKNENPPSVLIIFVGDCKLS